MGQAAVNLPDPKQKPPAAMTSADDLLSQLAGAEIDRMLADADAKPGKEEPAQPLPLPDPAPSDPALEQQVDELLRQTQTTDQPSEPPAPEHVETQAPSPQPPIAEIEQPTTADERAALNTQADVGQAIETAVAQVKVRRSAPFIRLLEIINAPLTSCPDSVRDTVGKFAILTLMNAVGILMYLLLFRK